MLNIWCADNYGYNWPYAALGVNIFPPSFCEEEAAGNIDPATYTGYVAVQATCQYVGCMNTDATNYCGDCDTSVWGVNSMFDGCEGSANGIDLNDCTESPYTSCCGNGCEGFLYGCMDATACNWDSNANIDDGSCDYSCVGCTDSSANNYCDDCTIDNGSCEYPHFGCLDESAINYDQHADTDDGGCIYFTFGCMDPAACNFIGPVDVDNNYFPIDVQPHHKTTAFDLYVSDDNMIKWRYQVSQDDSDTGNPDDEIYRASPLSAGMSTGATFTAITNQYNMSSGMGYSGSWNWDPIDCPGGYPCLGELQMLYGGGSWMKFPPTIMNVDGEMRRTDAGYPSVTLSDGTVVDQLVGADDEIVIRPCWELDAAEWGYCDACTYPTDACTDCDGNAITEGDCNPIETQYMTVGLQLELSGDGGGGGENAEDTLTISTVEPWASMDSSEGDGGLNRWSGIPNYNNGRVDVEGIDSSIDNDSVYDN